MQATQQGMDSSFRRTRRFSRPTVSPGFVSTSTAIESFVAGKDRFRVTVGIDGRVIPASQSLRTIKYTQEEASPIFRIPGVREHTNEMLRHHSISPTTCWPCKLYYGEDDDEWIPTMVIVTYDGSHEDPWLPSSQSVTRTWQAAAIGIARAFAKIPNMQVEIRNIVRMYSDISRDVVATSQVGTVLAAARSMLTPLLDATLAGQWENITFIETFRVWGPEPPARPTMIVTVKPGTVADFWIIEDCMVAILDVTHPHTWPYLEFRVGQTTKCYE